MKNSAKHKVLGLLMIISQVLLTGFAVYWLAGQYTKEKQSLWGDLKRKYENSYKVTLDSFLVKHYIEPALGDSTVNFYRYSRSTPAVVLADSIELKNFNVDSLTAIKPAQGVVTIKMSSLSDSSKWNQVARVEELEHEMLLQSVRLIVEHTGDSASLNVNARHHLGRNIDTVLFVTTFETQLAEDDMNFKIEWLEATGDSVQGLSKGDIFIGGWIDDVPAVRFEGYRMLLLGRILPQILFVLLLILLTGLAFLLAYRSLRKQTQLNEMGAAFISNMSHELKTPVSTVKVALEALRGLDLKKDISTAGEYLDMSAKELKRLELLIIKVLDNSLIEHDSTVLAMEEASLSTLIEAAIDSIKPKIIDTHAIVNFTCLEDIVCSCDPLYFQGVIINLIDNSIKYGNGNPQVEIVLQRNNGRAVISVSDKGPGIPEKYIKQVFDKFFRIPTSDIHNVKGYGLGLSYASLIVKMHNGSITVKNKEKGCTFTIEIPIKTLED